MEGHSSGRIAPPFLVCSFLEYLQGRLSNTELLGYEAEILINYRNGLGLPCNFYDLPSDVAEAVMTLQSEAVAAGLW